MAKNKIVRIYRLRKGREDRFWKGELRGSVLTISEGDMASPEAAQVRVYDSPKAYQQMQDEMIDRGNRGYKGLLPDQFEAALKQASAAGPAARPTPRVAPSGRGATRTKSAGNSRQTEPSSTVDPASTPAKRLSAAPVRIVRRSGPYARTFTGPAIHRLKFAPVPQKTGKTAPRATSGGRPILAEGQPWPLCAYCEQRLGLYLQFDVEDRFELAFPADSHILIFHCPDCLAVPVSPRGDTLPAEWLAPDFRSLYRIIVNPPDATEVVHKRDPRIKEQKLTFVAGTEEVTNDPDGPVGVDDVKVGGLPHWVQPPDYRRCVCGKPLGFIMQVPTSKPIGWMRKRPDDLAFAGGMNAFLFACTVTSSPYATLLIAQS